MNKYANSKCDRIRDDTARPLNASTLGWHKTNRSFSHSIGSSADIAHPAQGYVGGLLWQLIPSDIVQQREAFVVHFSDVFHDLADVWSLDDRCVVLNFVPKVIYNTACTVHAVRRTEFHVITTILDYIWFIISETRLFLPIYIHYK